MHNSEITRTSHAKLFYLAPLLKACRMCYSMIAKFQNFHERSFPQNPPLIEELNFATSEIHNCIKGLETCKEEFHKCVLLTVVKDKMRGLDQLVYKSVRVVLSALYFLHMMKGKHTETGKGIVDALSKIIEDLSPFSNIRKPVRYLDSPNSWPSVNAVLKITGLHFIITREAITAFGEKIINQIDQLLDMLKG